MTDRFSVRLPYIGALTSAERLWLSRSSTSRRRNATRENEALGWVLGKDLDGGARITNEDGYGDVKSVAELIQKWLLHFRPTEFIELYWSETSAETFCGGGVFITADRLQYSRPRSEFRALRILFNRRVS